jgi:cell division protein FtsI (penicillin-binding protein 3)
MVATARGTFNLTHRKAPTNQVSDNSRSLPSDPWLSTVPANRDVVDVVLGGREPIIGRDFAFSHRPTVSAMSFAAGRPLRLRLIGMFALGWVILLVGRMYSLQVSDFETWQDWAIKQHVSEVEIAAERGPVLDRNGKLMSVSVPTESVYVRPKQVRDKDGAARALASLLEMSTRGVREKLASEQPFVWIKRQVPRFQVEKIPSLGIQGVGTVIESRRFYPYNQAASALIGKVGIDGKGLSGIESLYEKRLHEDHVKSTGVRDAFGKVIQISQVGEESAFEIPKGEALRLSIDADLQLIMDEELELGRKEANAKQAMAVMIDSESGEIVALSQSPSYNFNNPAADSKNALRNLLVEAVFEPGSVMKPIVAAAAIDAGVVSPSELVNCENGRYRYSTHTIKDVHPSGVIPFYDVVVRSSNIGMTKVGLRLGQERLYSYLRKFGFGTNTNLGLAGESAGILRDVKGWAKIDVATHSFGQGVAVTPLQVVRAVAAIANGGALPTLSVLAGDGEALDRTRVVSQKAAYAAREMMYGVVEDEHGTGGKAKIEGLRVGGKTGTAQKASPKGRGYVAGSYVASFVGFVDGSPLGVERNLTAMVIMDEPRAKSIYGGTLAAPVFKNIMERSFKFMATRRQLVGSDPSDNFMAPDLPSGNPSLPEAAGVKTALVR